MRVLYVAATRAEDRLIFSGAVEHKELESITKTDFEPALSRQRQHLFRDVDGAREPAHMRPCGAQQPQFSERGLT